MHSTLLFQNCLGYKRVFFGSQILELEKNSFRDFSELRQFYRISLKYGIGIADTHIIFQGYSKKMSELGEISKKRFLNLGTKKKRSYMTCRMKLNWDSSDRFG